MPEVNGVLAEVCSLDTICAVPCSVMRSSISQQQEAKMNSQKQHTQLPDHLTMGMWQRRIVGVQRAIEILT